MKVIIHLDLEIGLSNDVSRETKYKATMFHVKHRCLVKKDYICSGHSIPNKSNAFLMTVRVIEVSFTRAFLS